VILDDEPGPAPWLFPILEPSQYQAERDRASEIGERSISDVARSTGHRQTTLERRSRPITFRESRSETDGVNRSDRNPGPGGSVHEKRRRPSGERVAYGKARADLGKAYS